LSLTNYEKRSLIRFLATYLGSVFILLAIIGFLFFQNSATAMKSALKFEMLYEVENLQMQLMQKLMSNQESNLTDILKGIHSNRFKVGFFDKDNKPIYSEFGNAPGFSSSFFLGDKECYSMSKNRHMPNRFINRSKVKYIVLKESQLYKNLQALKLKIIGYLVLSFIFMSIIGYYLARLFLKPIKEKIEALNSFIEETTHELNTPISAILMTISQLKDIDNKKIIRLKASAKRLSNMYDALSFSLLQDSLKQTRVQIDLKNEVAERIEQIEALALSKKLKIISNLQSCIIKFDKEEIKRVIDNILSNAIKYSHPNSKIEVTLNSCILKIKDYGVGLSQSEQKEIFKRYFRANRKQGGFGIGLSIVYQICKRNGVKISIESTKGEGTIFILDFT